MIHLRTVIPLGVIALVSAAALGGVVGVSLISPATPQSAQTAAPVTSLEVVLEDFDDSQDTQVTTKQGPAQTLLAPRGGVVTRLECSQGTSIVSGTSPVAIDGAPIIALATSEPLWRDLPRGAHGADVDSLQAELTRLGFTLTSDRHQVGSATLNAFATLLSRASATTTQVSQITLTDVTWLPAAQSNVDTCSVTLGQHIEADATIATFPPRLTSAKLAALPTDSAPGARVVTVAGVTTPIDNQGAITSPEALAQIAASPDYAAALSDPNSPGLAATTALATPISVAALPASALRTSGTNTCVFSDSTTPHDVTPVGSELGQVYVMFADTPPQQVLASPPQEATCR